MFAIYVRMKGIKEMQLICHADDPSHARRIQDRLMLVPGIIATRGCFFTGLTPPDSFLCLSEA